MDMKSEDQPRSHFVFTVEIMAQIGEESGTVKINVLTATNYNYVREIDMKRATDSAMIQFMKSLPEDVVKNTHIQKSVILGIFFIGEMTEAQFREVDEIVPPTKKDLEKLDA